MIYFIGGSPRTGKSPLLHSLLKNTQAQTLSTDALRDAIRKTQTLQSAPELFLWRETNQLDEEDWIREYTVHAKAMSQVLLKESSYIQLSIMQYIQTICNETNDDLIIEGVAVLPELLDSIKRPYKAVFLVDTSLGQAGRLYKYSMDNDKDWMYALKYTKRKIDAWAHFNVVFGQMIKERCRLKELQCYDISENGFEDTIDLARDYLLG